MRKENLGCLSTAAFADYTLFLEKRLQKVCQRPHDHSDWDPENVV